MAEFALLLWIILGAVMIFMLAGIKKKLTSMKQDQQTYSYRIDHLRWEIEKLAKKEGIVEVQQSTRAPVLQTMPPPLPQEGPRTVAAMTPAARVAQAPTVVPPPIPYPVQRPEPVAVKAPAEKPQSEMAGNVIEMLRKIWSWLVVGEEFRRKDVTKEFSVATTQLLRFGVIAIAVTTGYFLQWSSKNGYLTPPWRVGLSMVAGIGLLVAGVRLLGKKYHVIAQGLLGCGILVLYLSAFTAGPMYRLFGDISVPVAFALMIVVTVTAGVLSVKTDSLLIAILGLAGGFMTPILIRTPTPNLPAFYSYMLLLNVAILFIAYGKEWRLLNYLAFILTYTLYGFATVGCTLFGLNLPTVGQNNVPIALVFLCLFFVINSALVYINNIHKEKISTTLDVVHLVANAMAFSWFGYYLIEHFYHRPYPALMSLGLAIFYTVHVVIFLRRGLLDRPLLLSLVALAGVFAAWTLPLVFEKEELTIFFALLALMFLWLGRKTGSNFIQHLGYALYAVVFVRMLGDLHDQFATGSADRMEMDVYWRHMSNRLWQFGASILSIVGAFIMQRRDVKVAGRFAVTTDNDLPALVPGKATENVFYWAAVFFAFLFMHLELNVMFGYFDFMRLPVLTVLWCGLAMFFLSQYTGTRSGDMAVFGAMWFCVIVAAGKLFAIDLGSWKCGEDFIYGVEYNVLYSGMRLLDFGIVILAAVTGWTMLRSRPDGKIPASAFGYLALGLFFVYTTLELRSLLHYKLPDFRNGGISVLWAVFAITFLSVGIWKEVRTLRYMGLALFAIVALKVVFVDMQHLAEIYKIIVFFAIGALLLLGSFLYIYAGSRFKSKEPEEKTEGTKDET